MPKRADPDPAFLPAFAPVKARRNRAIVNPRGGPRGGSPKSIPEWNGSIKQSLQRELLKLSADGKRTKLEAMIAMAVEEASAGNVEMLKVILDRLEGKVTQAVDVSGTIQLGWAEMLKKAIDVREVPLLDEPA